MNTQASKACKKTTIGGQALIEGLMMVGPQKKAMAVRKPDGTIHLEYLPQKTFRGLATVPFVRGSIRLVSQLISGTAALMRSAEISEPPAAEQEAAQPAGFLDRFFSRHPNLAMTVTALLGLFFSIALFMLLPGVITDLIKMIFSIEVNGRGPVSFGLTMLEGAIRIGLFLLYLWLTSRLKDIRRVWMYHGAEHKTIACYEDGEPLTPENVRRYSRLHPRCGTSFLFIVMLVSILVFALVGWQNRLLNLVLRLLLLPLIAGIAYEIIRLTGRHDNWLTRLVSAPGLALQNLTTSEPDEPMLEVAIAAMTAVLPEQEGTDDW